MTAAVDWDVARRVATRFANRQATVASPSSSSLVADFTAFSAQAEVLVGATTGLHSLAGPARARVVGRDAWIDANLASFERMLRPLLAKFDDKVAKGRLGPVTRRATGAELGVLLGWMSTRVLGQYDLLIIEDEDPDDQDLVYYVGPNVLALEKRFAFPPKEFRLWLALHEVTHRAQFTGVPWLRPYFLSLVETLMSSVDPDPQRLLDAVNTVLEKRRAGEDPMADGGVMGLVATPEQKVALDKISGMMSLLEGHGDVTMDRAGHGLVPSADRFARVLRQRRQNASGPVKLLQQLIGLEAKLNQYVQGERFIEAVEQAGGPELLARAWEHPSHLPTLLEIREPASWIRRLSPALAP
jgi:coenzyme F420 biosynthesis associated uncharacterized protein